MSASVQDGHGACEAIIKASQGMTFTKAGQVSRLGRGRLVAIEMQAYGPWILRLSPGTCSRSSIR